VKLKNLWFGAVQEFSTICFSALGAAFQKCVFWTVHVRDGSFMVDVKRIKYKNQMNYNANNKLNIPKSISMLVL
jgi:hypothetical protein